jgi:hypothetical protein
MDSVRRVCVTCYSGIAHDRSLNSQAAFGSLDLPWKPGHLRSAYGALCCHKFKPQNITDDIFLAQILGHKLLGPNASLSVGQSYKDFYIR